LWILSQQYIAETDDTPDDVIENVEIFQPGFQINDEPALMDTCIFFHFALSHFGYLQHNYSI